MELLLDARKGNEMKRDGSLDVRRAFPFIPSLEEKLRGEEVCLNGMKVKAGKERKDVRKPTKLYQGSSVELIEIVANRIGAG